MMILAAALSLRSVVGVAVDAPLVDGCYMYLILIKQNARDLSKQQS
jgi:hypothetical protein